MKRNEFTATLLRTSASGFAAMALGRCTERAEGRALQAGGREAWQAQLQSLVLELSAAVGDGEPAHFASKLTWARDAFAARGMSTEALSLALHELGAVLEEVLPPEAWGAASTFFEAGVEALKLPPEPAPVPEPLGSLERDYLDALQRGDAALAIEGVTSAVRGGELSVADALSRVLVRAQREVGRLWHTDVVSVAEEHFATQVSGRLLEHLLLLAPEAPDLQRTVLLTMAEGDSHDLGLRLVAAFFELDGWRTICLGANLPAEDLVLAAERFSPDLMVLGATLNTQRESAARALEAIRQSRPGQRVLVGGPAFAQYVGRPQDFGADACALSPKEAASAGRALFGL